MNIGFIGLGNMGGGMARNLLNYCQTNNHRLIVFDVNTNAVDNMRNLGAECACSVAELAARSEIVFTSLPSATEINEVAQGEHGLLKNLPDGSIWFETSTNELPAWQALCSQSRESLSLVDAPVTGGSHGANDGSLTMLLGIEDALLDKYRDLLASFTKNAIRMGNSGAGYVAKLCQLHLNYLVAQGIGEAMMLGAKAQLDMTTLHRVLQNSCAQSYVVDNYIPKVLDGGYDPSFTLGLANKDMRLITELGKHLEVPLDLADQVYSSYQNACTEYGNDQPHLKIVKLLEDQVGLKLRS